MLLELRLWGTEAEEDGVCVPEEADGVRPESAPVALLFAALGTTGVAEEDLFFFGIRAIVDGRWQMAARGLGIVTVAGTGASFERG